MERRFSKRQQYSQLPHDVMTQKQVPHKKG